MINNIGTKLDRLLTTAPLSVNRSLTLGGKSDFSSDLNVQFH